MLPISWPVSVVLAVLLSVIHLSHRVATNAHAFPELFIEQVGVVGRSNNSQANCPNMSTLFSVASS